MAQRIAQPAGYSIASATRNLPRVYAGKSGGLTTAQLAASASAVFVVQVQAGVHFLLKSITAAFDQNDWSYNVTIGAYQRSLFDDLVRGAGHFFGNFDTATAAPRWDAGYQFRPPVFVPSQSNITLNVTNGATGVLNISFAFHGEDQQVAAVE